MWVKFAARQPWAAPAESSHSRRFKSRPRFRAANSSVRTAKVAVGRPLSTRCGRSRIRRADIRGPKNSPGVVNAIRLAITGSRRVRAPASLHYRLCGQNSGATDEAESRGRRKWPASRVRRRQCTLGPGLSTPEERAKVVAHAAAGREPIVENAPALDSGCEEWIHRVPIQGPRLR